MKVKEKQRNSKMCFICGMDNVQGLKAQFYSMEDSSVVSLFKYNEYNQSFPGRVHGGLISAMLDELGFRALWSYGKEGFGVTMDLNTKYRKPIPYDVSLLGRGIVTYSNSSFLKADAQIFSLDGTLLSSGEMTYRILPLSTIAKDASIHTEMPYLIDDGINDIDLSFIKE